MIELEHVTKHYGNKTAVRDLSLRIEQGELFAFLGPNGAGKTTTIKMICGLLFPSEGTIRVGGCDLRQRGEEARSFLSYVPDQPFLYEKLSGREFLQFIAEMYGLPPKFAAQRMEDVIELFQLREYIDDLTEAYSHGMRQRTVFAAALLHNPRVLVVDEPTVGLDPRSVRMIKNMFRDLAALGTTIFLSTHSLDIAQEVAQRIGIVDHGRLISCGTLDALRRQAAVEGSLEDVFLRLTGEAGSDGELQQKGPVPVEPDLSVSPVPRGRPGGLPPEK